MVPVHEKVQEILDWQGISQYRLAELSGIPKGSIGGYVSGRTPISLDILEKLADGLGVSPWILLNGASLPLPEDTSDLTPEEQELVVDMRGLSKANRRVVMATVKALVQEYGIK